MKLMLKVMKEGKEMREREREREKRDRKFEEIESYSYDDTENAVQNNIVSAGYA